jgi:hypothetical protein
LIRAAMLLAVACLVGACIRVDLEYVYGWKIGVDTRRPADADARSSSEHVRDRAERGRTDARRLGRPETP